jgi:GxxExxY protein
MMSKKDLDALSYLVIGCAIEIHKELGPGLLESVYETCFLDELKCKELFFQSQLVLPILYKGKNLETSLRLDVLVEDILIVELKSVETIIPIHQAQLLTYVKLLEKPKGIIINFNCTNIFKEGQKTLVNEYYSFLR